MDIWGFTLAALVTVLIQAMLTEGTLTMEDLETIELCGYVGGYCRVGTCHRELKHVWRIPLCHNSNHICCTEPAATTTMSNHVPRASECTRHEGICNAWYNNCTGTVVQYQCDNAWQSCCMPSLAPPVTDGTVNVPTIPPEPAHSLTPGQCGQQVRAPRQKRIIGGSLSQAGTWPWHVGISSAIGYLHCAGTIVGNKWILTAAHCFKKMRDYSLYRIVTGPDPSRSRKSYSIKRVVKHSLYREHNHMGLSDHSHKYDIALVELNEAISYGDDIQPACLPVSTDEFEGRNCWLTGWGSTRFNSTSDDIRLRHVRGPVLSKSSCQAQWGSLVDNKMLCFGSERRGGCAGDSGGGMFCEDSEGHYTIAGIISWGSAQCNGGSTVLTDIAQYHSWLHSTMNS